MTLFAPTTELLEFFLDALGDKELDLDNETGRIVIVPAPKRNHPLGAEILDSLQVPLKHFYFGAARWKGKKASYPFVCKGCHEWRMMTTDRSKTKCFCGHQGRYRLDIPWRTRNRHGRPDAGHRHVPIEE